MAHAKRKPYLKAAVFGIISITSYAVFFSNREAVMEYFTHGGVHAALPVTTAFFFSFIHGAFASNVLDVLGIKAKRKK
ncbi:MAG: hypothetical protein P8Y66_06285 [Nitrospirota bacterium]|jgi:hypothetical protein